MSSENKQHTDLIDSLYQCANVHLVEAFSRLLEDAPAHLDELADGCGNDSDKELVFSLHHFIGSNTNALRQDFFVAVNQQFTATRDASDGSDGSDELSLVSEDEMEELVAITTLSGHAMNHYGNLVDELEARLEYLEISGAQNISKDTLNPDKIGAAFRDTIQAYTLELAQKQELFRLFDQLLACRLEPMYRELNQLLIDADILPHIMLKTNRHTEEEEVDDTGVTVMPARTEISHNTRAEQAIPRSQSDLDYIAANFMSSDYVADADAVHLPESFRRPVAKPGEDGRNYFERKDVVKALSRLQKKIIDSGETGEPKKFEQIKRSLLVNMAQSEGNVSRKRVNTMDERNIDFVGMMFDEIAQDDSLSVHIKNLMLRMQLPLLKAAMTDEELYRQESHPARRMLDLLSEAGKGVEDSSEQLYSSLQQIVDRVIHDPETDQHCFESAAGELEQLIQQETEATQAQEREQQRAIVYANAREVIVEEVRHITREQHVPCKVTPLITKNWPSLMINRYVKHGKESWQWLESVMLMRLLIKCLQPITNDSQWQTVWDNHLALVDAVYDELRETKQDLATIEEQAGKLRETFTELLDAWGFKLADDSVEEQDVDLPAANDESVEEVAGDAQDIHRTHIDEIAELARKKLENLPGEVHPGVWFEIHNGEGHAVRRLKLSVVLTEVAKLVFVDRKGVKVIEKDAAEFAAELSEQRSKVIADHSTFEHALGRVIGALAA